MRNYYKTPPYRRNLRRRPHHPHHPPCPPGNKPGCVPLKDYGGKPFVINIEQATIRNKYYRLALWTGKHLQLTLMSIPPGEDIGLEAHHNLDQFIRIEDGNGLVEMGYRRDHLNYKRRVSDDDAILIPAGTWHNLTNTGTKPLKLYSIYAPPEHSYGTVHRTKADAEEHEHGY